MSQYLAQLTFTLFFALIEEMIGLLWLYLTVILKDLVNVFQFWVVRKEVDFMNKVLHFLPEIRRSWKKDFTKEKNKYITNYIFA